MKTNDLVEVLSKNVEAVDPGRVARELVGAVVVGTLAVLGFVLVARGIRADVHDLHALAFLLLKLGFAVGVVIWGSVYLVRLARPGGEAKATILRGAWPLIGIALLAALSLIAAPIWHWHSMAVGDGWLECLISIPLIAIVPFAVVVWVLRRMAPTNLTRAGALAGLVAGGMSAVGYALHCTGDSLPFIALWYGGTIALCTLAGAMLGPRLLRW
jgi:hypothetical protein